MNVNLDDKSFLCDIGHRLREQRLAQALTQAELGRRCVLNRTFIGSVERGERNVSVLNIRKLAKVLRIPLHDLFHDLK